jgi:hypothetical protein
MENIMKIKGILLWLGLVSLASGAQAAMLGTVIDNSDFSTDTATGLDWLDVTKTRGLSWNAVNAATLPGASATTVTNADGDMVDLAGWRFATGAEFDELVQNFGYNALTTGCAGGVLHCDSNAGQPALIEGMISYLGDTRAAVAPGTYNIGNGYTLGWLADVRGATTRWQAIIDDSQANQFDDFQDTVATHLTFGNANNTQLGLGSFLVRTSAVPIPAAGWLFISAIAGLVGRRKLSRG